MLLTLAWRNIWRNKKRSLITLSSIAVAVFLSVLMRSMQLGMYDKMIDNVIGAYVGYVQIHAKGFWEERSLDNGFVSSSADQRPLSEVEGVLNIFPRLEAFGLISKGELSNVVSINGIDIDKEEPILNLTDKLLSGSLFEAKNEVIVGTKVASYFNVQVNDTLIFIGQGYQGMMAAEKLTVSGIVDFKNPNLNKAMVLTSLPSAQQIFSAPDLVTSLVVNTDKPNALAALQKRLSVQLSDKEYEILTWPEMFPELEQTILADSIGGIIMVMILYMILIFGIFGTVLMMTQERKYELGVLVAIGMKKGKLMLMVVLETLILSLLGVLVGVLLVYPILLWKHYDPFQLPGDTVQMMEEYGFSPEIPFYIHLDLPLIHAGILFCIALIVALYPIYIIRTLAPIKAMHNR